MELFWKPFSAEEEARLVASIVEAEKLTSAEIRVHADRYCKNDPVNKAANLFKKLKMDETEEKNGVLIYISIEDRKFAIIGDVGINNKVETDFWQSTRDKMLEAIRSKDLVTGIIIGIDEAALQLAKHFPPGDSDRNELTNEISYG